MTDPDPGGPKTKGSFGSESGTTTLLSATVQYIKKIFKLNSVETFKHGLNYGQGQSVSP
jgi:hypothetical protein